MSENENRNNVLTAAFIVAVLLPGWYAVWHVSMLPNPAKSAGISNPGQPDRPARKASEAYRDAADDLPPFEKLKRQHPLSNDGCYSGEHIGECAARIVQERVANFYLWLVIAAMGQAMGVAGTIFLLNGQNDIAERQGKTLSRIERAYVFCEVHLVKEPEHVKSGLVKVDVTVRFTNHGKTPAIIRAIEATVLPHSFVPSMMPGSAVEIPQSLVIGVKTPYPASIKSIVQAETWSSDNNSERTDLLYCYGRIKYEDVMGKSRETGFCWQYSALAENARFVVTNDSPLNYFT